MDFSKLYSSAPSQVQDLAVSIVGWRANKTRYGRLFEDALNGYMRRDRRADLTQKFQRDMLAAALERASMTPYYAHLFREMGLEWHDFLEERNFSRLPILGKADLVGKTDEFRPRGALPSDNYLATSGTTGASLSFPISAHVDPDQWAVWWRYRSWHGLRRGDRCALFASAPVIQGPLRGKPYRVNLTSNEFRFSIFHINEHTAKAYVDALNRIQPVWIHGNPTAIALLATFIVKLGLRLDLSLKAITVGSENLLGWQAAAIETAFGRSAIQHYGLAEAVANISECEYGTLHTDEDFSFVEYVDSGRDGVCSIVGTAFSNTAFTLLRYDTGDLATPSKVNFCQCGRPGRVVQSIDGRLTDYVVLPSGAKVASLAAPFHASSGLAGAQIVQDKQGGLTVRYVPGVGWKGEKTLLQLEESLRVRLGDEIGISFREVEELQRTPRGKVKLVISEFDG